MSPLAADEPETLSTNNPAVIKRRRLAFAKNASASIFPAFERPECSEVSFPGRTIVSRAHDATLATWPTPKDIDAPQRHQMKKEGCSCLLFSPPTLQKWAFWRTSSSTNLHEKPQWEKKKKKEKKILTLTNGACRMFITFITRKTPQVRHFSGNQIIMRDHFMTYYFELWTFHMNIASHL